MGIYSRVFRQFIRPRKPVDLDEWADTNRVLPSSTSSEPGKWRTSRTEYLREISKRLSASDRSCHTIIVMKSSQLGFSELGTNWIGYIIDEVPSPALVVLPSHELAKRYSRQRISPLLHLTDSVHAKVEKSSIGKNSKNLLERSFLGGHLLLTGSNSANALRQYSARFAFLDELDGFVEATSEGTPWELVNTRLSGFGKRKKVLAVSTPTVEGESLTEELYLQGDQRKYYVPCPHCNEFSVLEWHRFKWEEKKPETVTWNCPNCETPVSEQYKLSMLAKGEWRATAEPTVRGVTSYHLSSMYSPFLSWEELAGEFQKVAKNREKLRTFVNTKLGETFKDVQKTTDPHVLYARRENYPAEVPGGGVILTAGVDVQQNRLEVTVNAYGKGEETWNVTHKVLYGDPTKDVTWKALDEVLQAKYEHESGKLLPIAAACIDAGYLTDEVVKYCKSRTFMRLFPVVGRAGWDRPITAPPRIVKTAQGKKRSEFFVIGVDNAKATIYNRLALNDVGPGYYHFPQSEHTTEAFFDQLTGERLYTVNHNGKQVRRWKLKNADTRVEVLDCNVYSLAALYLSNADLDKYVQYFSKDIADVDAPVEKKNKKRVTRKRRNKFTNLF